MEQRLKQRLVGATVLVILVVVVVPELVDSDHPAQQPAIEEPTVLDSDFSSRIVPIDEATTTAEALSQAEATVAASARQDTGDEPTELETANPASAEITETVTDATAGSPASAGSSSTPRPRVKPALESVGASATAWVVQLASFSEAERAVSLRNRLDGKGYAAFIRSAANDAGTFTRVYVGPELDRGRADALRAKLAQDIDLEGRVVKYPGG